MVVGLDNTGGDTAVSLIGHAEKVYLSSRRGAAIVGIPYIFHPKIDADPSQSCFALLESINVLWVSQL